MPINKAIPHGMIVNHLSVDDSALHVSIDVDQTSASSTATKRGVVAMDVEKASP